MSGWSGAAGAGPGPYRWVVVGNGENRRVGLFVAAAEAAGVGTPRVVEWRDVLRDGGHMFADDEIVRLDSPGENAEVDRLLRGVDDPTRVEGSATWYTRFLAAVGSLRGGLRLDDPADLPVLFDKRLCHARLDAAGVPVPPSPTSGDARPVRGWDDVRAAMREHGMPRVFVKPAHGSSASGVLAVESTASGRIRATTSVEVTADEPAARPASAAQLAAGAALLGRAGDRRHRRRPRGRRAARRALAAEGVRAGQVRRSAGPGRGGPGHARGRPHQPFPDDQSPSRRGPGRSDVGRGRGGRPLEAGARHL